MRMLSPSAYLHRYKPVADDAGPSKCIEPGFNFKDARLEGNKWMNLTDAEAGGYVQVE